MSSVNLPAIASDAVAAVEEVGGQLEHAFADGKASASPRSLAAIRWNATEASSIFDPDNSSESALRSAFNSVTSLDSDRDDFLSFTARCGRDGHCFAAGRRQHAATT